MVAAAVIGGAVIGAAGTAIAGHEAASATESASNASIAEQNAALAQQAALAAPYTALGQAAIPQYEALLGIGGGGSPAGRGQVKGGSPTGTAGAGAPVPGSIEATLAATPGYQFTQSQGETGILNAASASGGVSGNTLAALDQYNTGLADQTYQTELGDIQGAVGIGQAAAAGQATNIGTAAGNISDTLINQGNTIAGIDANTAAGITKAIGGASDSYLTLQALSALNSQGDANANPYVS